jgi:16S rRNA (adenine1518-N6/adenine1519-N6)-dimethyltransferase
VRCLEDNLPVLEIGAGLGMVTSALNQKGLKITAVEYDKRLYEWLCSAFKGEENVKILFSDILKFDIHKFAEEKGGKINIIGNIPYSISSPLVVHILENSSMIKTTVFTVQKEVANRLVSKPGSKSYGRLSVFLQYKANAECVMDIPPQCFYPEPGVTSTVLRIDFPENQKFDVHNESIFLKVVKHSFSQRRKILLNTLKGHFKDIKNILEDCNIDPKIRAEKLSIEDFVRIANKIVVKGEYAEIRCKH